MSKTTPNATISQHIGQALQQARLRSGITQAELGHALGVKRVTVSRWERGERSLDITTLLTIARLLHIDPATLLPDTEPILYEQLPSTPSQQSIAESPYTHGSDLLLAIELLYQHPQLAGSVIELIETMMEDEESESLSV